VGTHSPWVSRHLRALWHEVIVANPHRTPLIAEADNKQDRVDAETLARLARAINTARGPTKSFGERPRKSDAQSVDERLAQDLPLAVQTVVAPLLAQAREWYARIREHDETIQKIARERYPEAALLTAVHGVGVLMALTFVLTIDDRSRFERSSAVHIVSLRPRIPLPA